MSDAAFGREETRLIESRLARLGAALKRNLRKYEDDRAWRTLCSSRGVTVLHERMSRRSGAGK